jgi:RNA polymerase primary sigma factor
MPSQKSSVNAAPAKKPAAKKPIQPASPAKPDLKVVKASAGAARPTTKDQPVPSSSKSTLAKTDKAAAKDEPKTTAKAAAAAAEDVKKKPGRPPKAAAVEAEAPGKAGAKRGRKPKADGPAAKPAVEDEDLSDIEAEFAEEEPVVAEAAEKAKPLRMKISKAKERALMKEFGLDETILTEEEMLKRRQRLKTLIKLGKTRGYLTHAEITDHLPEKLVDAETLEVVVSMLNDMGVAVYEQTPDAETLLLTNTGPTAATEEEAEEEAEAALSTVDSEFGRTTDSVRMYMREMGTVELLTREGEIEIAKRIEGGLQAMMEAISASPATIAEILRLAADIREGKVVISQVVDGFSDPNEADDYVAEEDFDEFDADDDDDGNGGSKALTKKLEELKAQALERFARIAELFEKVHRVYDKEGYGTPAYNKAQHALSEELMTIRFTAKTIEKLCDMVRGQVDDVRKKERELRRIIVDKCGMPQEVFIKEFPPNLLNLRWVEKQAQAGKPWSPVIQRNIPPIQELQQKLMDLQSQVVVPLHELKARPPRARPKRR